MVPGGVHGPGGYMVPGVCGVSGPGGVSQHALRQTPPAACEQNEKQV